METNRIKEISDRMTLAKQREQTGDYVEAKDLAFSVYEATFGMLTETLEEWRKLVGMIHNVSLYPFCEEDIEPMEEKAKELRHSIEFLEKYAFEVGNTYIKLVEKAFPLPP